MPISREDALNFLHEAEQHQQEIGSHLATWHPSGEDILAIIGPILNHRTIEQTKTLEEIRTELTESFDPESDEVQWIAKFIARRDMVAAGKKSTCLSNLEESMSKVQDFFLERAKNQPDQLSTVRVGLKEYQVNPHNFYYINPFYTGSDELTRQQRLERIQTVLNEQFETSVCLDMFFDNNCHYMPRAECMERYAEPLKDAQRKQLVALMALHGAGLVQAKENTSLNTQRFFKISDQLPQDVREQLAQKLTGSKKSIVTDEDVKQKAKEELRKMGPGQS